MCLLDPLIRLLQTTLVNSVKHQIAILYIFHLRRGNRRKALTWHWLLANYDWYAALYLFALAKDVFFFLDSHLQALWWRDERRRTITALWLPRWPLGSWYVGDVTDANNRRHSCKTWGARHFALTLTSKHPHVAWRTLSGNLWYEFNIIVNGYILPNRQSIVARPVWQSFWIVHF